MARRQAAGGRRQELPAEEPPSTAAGRPARAARRRRDWRTPLLVTFSMHLMVFTLAINHHLFAMIEAPPPGPYVMKVSEIVGSDPDEEAQENDPGAAAGADSETPTAREVASAFSEMETAEVKPRPEREVAKEQPAEDTPKVTDPRSLSERLNASLQSAGGGEQSGGSVGLPGGGSHGLRGEGKHGVGLKRHGGSGETEDAVEMGLAWLASVQDSDGKWDSDGYMLHYMPNATKEERYSEGIGLSRNDIGLTGLCVLTFVGAGHTDHEGQYKAVVKRARQYLLGVQRIEDGGFGLERADTRATMYEHALATFAITDLYLQTGDETLRTPMRRALEYMLSMQGEGGGWDYEQRTPSATQWEPSTRDDLSITGWCVLALAAAREANFEIPAENLARLAQLLKDATRSTGEAVYADEGTRAGHRGMAMMAVSNVCRRLLGEAVDSYTQDTQLQRMAKTPPSWLDAGELDGSNMYYWYYGSIAMLLAKDGKGGDDRWRAWNVALKRTLVENQEKSGGRKGSFKPVGHWAKNGGGRVYSTAICVLNLEIYYRYEPEYLRAKAGELAHLWD
jgi:hypothetical protein